MCKVCDEHNTLAELICHMFFDGPVWDGNLISKQARDELVDRDLVDRAEGYNFLTVTGVEMAKKFGFTEWKTGRHPLASDMWKKYCERKGIKV